MFHYLPCSIFSNSPAKNSGCVQQHQALPSCASQMEMDCRFEADPQPGMSMRQCEGSQERSRAAAAAGEAGTQNSSHWDSARRQAQTLQMLQRSTWNPGVNKSQPHFHRVPLGLSSYPDQPALPARAAVVMKSDGELQNREKEGRLEGQRAIDAAAFLHLSACSAPDRPSPVVDRLFTSHVGRTAKWSLTNLFH